MLTTKRITLQISFQLCVHFMHFVQERHWTEHVDGWMTLENTCVRHRWRRHLGRPWKSLKAKRKYCILNKLLRNGGEEEQVEGKKEEENYEWKGNRRGRLLLETTSRICLQCPRQCERERQNLQIFCVFVKNEEKAGRRTEEAKMHKENG
jgi:hypothetical protein